MTGNDSCVKWFHDAALSYQSVRDKSAALGLIKANQMVTLRVAFQHVASRRVKARYDMLYTCSAHCVFNGTRLPL